MSISLDDELEQWIGRFAVDWGVEQRRVVEHLGRYEIANRNESYPTLAQALTRSPIELSEVAKAGKSCWAISERFDATRFSEFVSEADSADALELLVSDFPEEDDLAVARIDDFIARCGSLGYRDRKSGRPNASSAGLLASVILTAVYSSRFVDFRQSRWNSLADELRQEPFASEKATYGEMIVGAGQFAQQVCATAVFQSLWKVSEPLWTLAGICWMANSDMGAKRPENAELYFYEEDYAEGVQVPRLHLVRERSASVVQEAKRRWKADDPLLRCDVCGFSFLECYGDLGSGYIEAHHKVPLSSLKAGERTKPSDLAKVCANCHRMIHAKGDCRDLDELRSNLGNRT